MRKIDSDYENPIDNVLIDSGIKTLPFFKSIGFTPNLITTLSLIFGLISVFYLHKDNKKLSLDNTGVHDSKWLTYYHLEKDTIIYNPEHHFYLNGFKFATLDVVKKMKENRGEEKDI